MSTSYIHHRVLATPLAWRTLADSLKEQFAVSMSDGELYGIWRSQIGRPRDELNVITVWDDPASGAAVMDQHLGGLDDVADHSRWFMSPTLRPADTTPPRRQGNYAFRFFETPEENWREFLELCEGAWPHFEASYDSQIIGLWQIESEDPKTLKSLLVTRRPNLAMWERSKIPEGEREAEVRRKLSRRYDLCLSTVVYTSTLLTAQDHDDTARWT